MDDSLHIPSNKKSTPGLFIYCGQCRSIVTKTCKGSNKSIATCKYAHRHKYKLVMYANPDERRTKLLETRDYDEAVLQAIAFKKEIRAVQDEKNLSQAIEAVVHPNEIIQPPEIQMLPGKTYKLTELMARYIGYLNGDEAIVPAFKRRTRSKKHIQDIERGFLYFALALQKNGAHVQSLKITEITETMVGAYHDYLLTDKKFSNRSYNKMMGSMSTFYKYLKDEDGYQHLHDPFNSVPNRTVVSNPKAIEQDEFEKLLDVVKKPELGITTLSTGRKKHVYKPWLSECFELAAYSGRRNYEISRMAFNQVFEDENGEPLYIRIEDFKVNRQRGVADDDEQNKKYIFVPVIPELRDLLMRLGYERFKGTERYLIAGDDGIGRDTVKMLMSRAFTAYYSHIGDREITFKSFRKAYISRLTAFMGLDNARIITRHSNTEVIDQNYLDHKYIALTAKKFKVFSKQNNREKKLDQLRSSKNQPSIER